PPLAVLSHGLWARLGSDPSLVGRTVMLRGEAHTVVGVTPDGFNGGIPVDVWTPLRPSRRGGGCGQNYELLARLRAAVARPQADAEFASVARRSVAALCHDPASRGRRLVGPLQEGEPQDVRRSVLVLWGAVGGVLLIGCVNIAALLMARGVTRAPEI